MMGWRKAGALAEASMTLPPPPVRPGGAASPPAGAPGLTEPYPRPGGYPDAITRAIAEAKCARWFAAEAESIPGVRKALAVIVGTICTLRLAAWRGNQRLPDSAFPWLAQPDPSRTSQRILSDTIRDGIWFDRSVWRRTPGGFYRLSPDRVVAVPAADRDQPPAWLLDGQPVSADDLVIFDFSGAGGLRRFGAPLLEMFATLMAAASKYADEPVPSVILKNTGVDIDDTAIDAILARWEEARATRRTGFLNAYLEAITPGYNARDLQLVEVMDQVTKDVARLFGLPGWALGVDEGSSMTYSNVTDRRRDLLDALHPWTATVEQTLSLDAYAVTVTATGVTAVRRGLYVPYSTDVRFDTTDYLREGFSARVAALVAASGGPIMSPAEARTLEPTITNPSATEGLANAPAEPAPEPAPV